MRKSTIVTRSLNISLASDSTIKLYTVLTYLTYIASVVFLMHYNYAHCKYIHNLSLYVCLCLSKLFCAQMYNIYLRYVAVILVISTLLSVNTVRPFFVILAYDHCSIKNKHLNTNFQQQLRDKV